MDTQRILHMHSHEIVKPRLCTWILCCGEFGRRFGQTLYGGDVGAFLSGGGVGPVGWGVGVRVVREGGGKSGEGEEEGGGGRRTILSECAR